MKAPRNPYRLRASERIETTEVFLRLFSPDALRIVDELGEAPSPTFVRSAPGGGKTSLFRLLTPESLLSVVAYRASESYSELFRALESRAFVSREGPLALGVLVSCSSDMADVYDQSLSDAQRSRLTRALLNSRMTLAALRGACRLLDRPWPSGCAELLIEDSSLTEDPYSLPSPCTGQDVWEWARAVESSACDVLDSFELAASVASPGHSRLVFPSFVADSLKTALGREIKMVVMLDDVHELHPRQRSNLIAEMVRARPNTAVWIGERMQALDRTEMFTGASDGRDYSKGVVIESLWLQAHSRFSKAVSSAADRRAREVRDIEVSSFSDYVESELNALQWAATYEAGAAELGPEVAELLSSHERFLPWLRELDKPYEDPRDYLLAMMATRIAALRGVGRAQLTLDFAGAAEEWADITKDSGVRSAAELFIARRFKIPYYYGFDRLSWLGSANFEQFLDLAGDYFEEISSALLLRKHSFVLTAQRQQVIVQAASQRWLDGIPARVPDGRAVMNLVRGVCDFCESETFRGNAPYAPGVTGIALPSGLLEDESNSGGEARTGSLASLAHLLAVCVAHNILEYRPNQACKGKTWSIFYLNRLACPGRWLPLQYGGWRERRPAELLAWANGERPKKLKLTEE